MICFVDALEHEQKQGHPTTPYTALRVAELEQELEATKMELQGSIRNLEISNERQNAIIEEAMSLNALNSQLQGMLERQHTQFDDLQNILYSSDVAMLILDTSLIISFFTPAAKLFFNVVASDVGQPITSLDALPADGTLLVDATTVLQTLVPIEREFEARSGGWYTRRILPYRNRINKIAGVVIVFVDITERRQVADELREAKRQAEVSNVSKSRFLAAASHDLRQPLQTLALIQALLAKTVEGERANKLVAQIDVTLDAMAGMLNTLLDINQIEAGTVHAEMTSLPINDLLTRLKDEYAYHAQAKNLSFRMVPCSLLVQSDPRLLEQIIRNLLSNAFKYTKHGKVLLGCRRHKGMLSIEVRDTGVGIPNGELGAVFEEYHRVNNPARERNRGLGLGLSIVQRLGDLMGHRIRVRSRHGQGSVFAVEVMLTPSGTAPQLEPRLHGMDGGSGVAIFRTGTILVVEDDPDVCELLELFLKEEHYRAVTARDGVAALELVMHGTIRPDLILADYNLPNGMDGLQLAGKLREQLHRQIPAIILTGDISSASLRDIARQHCFQFNKPVKLKELMETIQRLLPKSQAAVHSRATSIAELASESGQPVIFIVDDDSNIREAVRAVVEDVGRRVDDYATCEAFLEAYRPGHEACLVIDAYLPGMDGLELLQHLSDAGHLLPAIMITGNSDVQTAVQAMKAGASDFIEKPLNRVELLASIERALEQSRDSSKLAAWREDAANHLAGLTPRQRQIMERVLAGDPSKNIAADLGISQRTVENHRAAIMKKTSTKSLPALARLALAASASSAR